MRIPASFYCSYWRRQFLNATLVLFATSFSHAQTSDLHNDTICTGAKTTAAMQSCENVRYEKASRDLESVYEQLASHLDASEKAKLHAAQEAWTRFRDADADFAADVAAGGTLAGLIKLTVMADMTESRVAQLKKELEEWLSTQ